MSIFLHKLYCRHYLLIVFFSLHSFTMHYARCIEFWHSDVHIVNCNNNKNMNSYVLSSENNFINLFTIVIFYSKIWIAFHWMKWFFIQVMSIVQKLQLIALHNKNSIKKFVSNGKMSLCILFLSLPFGPPVAGVTCNNIMKYKNFDSTIYILHSSMTPWHRYHARLLRKLRIANWPKEPFFLINMCNWHGCWYFSIHQGNQSFATNLYVLFTLGSQSACCQLPIAEEWI